MTIRQYRLGDPVAVGKYVNFDSAIMTMIAGAPQRVLRVLPHTLEVESTHTPTRPLIKRKGSLRFVCDTLEEADAVHALALKVLRDNANEIEELHQRQRVRRDQLIADLISSTDKGN